MYRLFIVIIGFLTIEIANSYVLQTRQQSDDITNLERPPHKISKRFDVRHNEDSEKSNHKSNSVESVALAIDTGLEQLMSSIEKQPDVVDAIAKSFLGFMKKADPYLIKAKKHSLEPEAKHFGSKKPSLVFEISSKSIIQVLKDLLHSKVVHQYMDVISKNAALIYRTLKEDIDNRRNNNDDASKN